MNKLFTVMGGKFKFKFQDQDSDLEYFFWRFEKRIELSEKELPLQLSFLFTLPDDCPDL